MYDLTQFAEHELSDLRTSLLTAFERKATCLEDAANAVVDAFQTVLCDPITGTSTCALVRCYITQRYDKLAPHLQQLADQRLEHANRAAIKYLVLLASRGDRAEWNDRTRSTAHQLIPLFSIDMVTQSPMIARMIKQFGFKLDALVAADVVELSMIANRTHNVFYVPVAVGSPYIPAQQEFVHAYSIKSVVGMGGILPYGHMFAVILFTKVAVPAHVIQLFATLATDIKTTFVPYSDKRVYAAPR